MHYMAARVLAAYESVRGNDFAHNAAQAMPVVGSAAIIVERYEPLGAVAHVVGVSANADEVDIQFDGVDGALGAKRSRELLMTGPE